MPNWEYRWLYGEDPMEVPGGCTLHGTEAQVCFLAKVGWELVAIADHGMGRINAAAVLRRRLEPDPLEAARDAIIRAVCTSSENARVLPIVEAVQMLRYEESVSEYDRDRRHYQLLREALEDYAAVCVKEQDGNRTGRSDSMAARRWERRGGGTGGRRWKAVCRGCRGDSRSSKSRYRVHGCN